MNFRLTEFVPTPPSQLQLTGHQRRVQQGRYCEISATIRYATLRFFIWRISTFKPTSKLRWACPHPFIIGPNFVEKMAASKI